MATAGHYSEMTAGWELVTANTGATGTRVFIDGDDSFSDSLPDIGDVWDATDTKLNALRVVSIRKVKNAEHPLKHIYTVSYTNSPGTTLGDKNDDDNNSDPDFLPISGSLSAELISFDTKKKGEASNWCWEGEVGDEVDQQVFRKTITGSFKVSKRMAALQFDKWSEYDGKINSDIVKVGGFSLAVGLVMFNGVEFEEYKNESGFRRWLVHFSFSVKKLQSAAAGVYVGWNYLYDESLGAFREVINIDTGDPMYESAALMDLLSPAENP